MRKKSQVMREIRAEVEKGVRYTKALKQIPSGKVSPQTIENWRERPLLERYFKAIIPLWEDKRVDAAEDTLAKRVISGKASPTEVIFYLCNRRPKRWKRMDSPVVDQSQHYSFSITVEKYENKDEIQATRCPKTSLR